VPTQLTVRLDDDLADRLARQARRLHLKRSDVVRLALRRLLEGDADGGERGRPVDRVRHLLGSLDSGQSNLAERHREAVLEVLRRGR